MKSEQENNLFDCGYGPYPGTVILRSFGDFANPVWLHFQSPDRILQTTSLPDVLRILAEIDAAVSDGFHAAGFISYEAAPSFDEAFETQSPGPLPLVWFGLYKHVIQYDEIPDSINLPTEELNWKQNISINEYQTAISRIKEYIASGDTYQVNYTMRLKSAFDGSAWAMFNTLRRAQKSKYSAYIDIGDHAICSMSPELFFALDGSDITCRPMKGTIPRGLTCHDDENRASLLRNSIKNRAENLMIVDMMRNDLGRIADMGSVRVPDLFAIERYATLFQMTSTVTAKTCALPTAVLQALFPCASITGAPKVRTMQIICELETEPRGIYTGCIGHISPGRKAQFSVAIRTVHVDRIASEVVYGTGGGIVWDSDCAQEYDECHTKAKLLFEGRRPSFQLLETILWKPEGGYFLLDAHMCRAVDSARYFGFILDAEYAVSCLETAAEGFVESQRVRCLISEDGSVDVQSTPFTPAPSGHVPRITFAKNPVDASDRFLYHKTTNRAVYESARADFPSHDDVILWNSADQVTESTIANIVIRREGMLITPPVECGLLPGVCRAHLLQVGQIKEGILTKCDLEDAHEIYLMNSVRGLIRAELE